MNLERPRRVSHVYTQQIAAPPEKVFPLLCPVRERDWVEGWDPEVVFTHSGVVEDECVFVTVQDGIRSIWIVTRYEPDQFISFVKTTPDALVVRISISLSRESGGTALEVRYSYSSLGAAGDSFIAEMDEARYESFMKDWESSMNRYLARS